MNFLYYTEGVQPLKSMNFFISKVGRNIPEGKRGKSRDTSKNNTVISRAFPKHRQVEVDRGRLRLTTNQRRFFVHMRKLAIRERLPD